VNPQFAASWNLLALLLSCRKDFKHAYNVCDAGWRECIGAFLKATTSGDTSESSLPWDSIDLATREDLFKYVQNLAFLFIFIYIYIYNYRAY
jgi:hypothetical protein